MDIVNGNKCPITHNLLTELNDPVIDIDGYKFLLLRWGSHL